VSCVKWRGSSDDINHCVTVWPMTVKAVVMKYLLSLLMASDSTVTIEGQYILTWPWRNDLNVLVLWRQWPMANRPYVGDWLKLWWPPGESGISDVISVMTKYQRDLISSHWRQWRRKQLMMTWPKRVTWKCWQ